MNLDLTFVPWVEPIAARLRHSRGRIAELARQITSERWSEPSPIEGWSFKDLLSHLGEGDVFCQAVIESALKLGPFDLREFSRGRESRTARVLEMGRKREVAELIQEVENEGTDTQRLLGQLSARDESVLFIVSNTRPVPVSLGEFLRGFSHDEEHLAHLALVPEVDPQIW